jgi:hypothetical protein
MRRARARRIALHDEGLPISAAAPADHPPASHRGRSAVHRKPNYEEPYVRSTIPRIGCAFPFEFVVCETKTKT